MAKRKEKKDQRIVVVEGPIAVFQKESVKTALMFQKQRGKLRKLGRVPNISPSRAPEIEYFRSLNALMSELRELVGQEVIKHLPAIVSDAPFDLRARQDVGEILEEVIQNLRLAFAARAPLEMIARRAGNDAERRNQEEQKRVVQTVLGIRPEFAEPWLTDLINQFAKSNARLVENVTGTFIDRLERRVADRVREGFRAEEIEKELVADFVSSQGLEVKRAKKRAKLIARDQVASLQGDITRVRQQNIGVRRYVWRTAEDERVRSSHRRRNGEIFEWGKPIGPQLRAKGLPVDTIDGHPGKPVNCRCYPEPVLSDIVPDAPEI